MAEFYSGLSENNRRSCGGLLLRRSHGDLKPPKRRIRRQSKKLARLMTDGITAFGDLKPVLAHSDGTVVCGYERLSAAKLASRETVPVIYVDHLTKDELRLYAVMESQLEELSEWSDELNAELFDLSTLDLDIPLTITGFETAEIDLRIADHLDAEDAPEEEPPWSEPWRNEPAVSEVGDVFAVGDHRLANGDALDASVYESLLGNARAQMVITDSPWNVPVNGHVSSTGRHREFAMASGEMSAAEFTQFLTDVIANLVAFSTNGSLHYLFMDHAHLDALLTAGAVHYTERKNIIAWVKTAGGMGGQYRSQHELIGLFKSGRGKHVNNIQLGKHGRNRTNVWRYPGSSSFGSGRAAKLAAHPTVKPVRLLADAILDSSNRGDVILDAFVGSGSTLLAAARTGRCGYGIELDSHYVDAALLRLSEATGEPIIHRATGMTFAELQEHRRAELAERADQAAPQQSAQT